MVYKKIKPKIDVKMCACTHMHTHSHTHKPMAFMLLLG